jgi:Asp-tRNA(Asn)/Glu-tRNA(Gln) amidotransferase A subunit family amidase
MHGAALAPDGYRQLVDDCHRYRASFAAAMDDRRLDILISAACSGPAVPHGAGSATREGRELTSLYSLLGTPAGVVAATRVRPDEEHDPGVSPESPAGRVNAGSAGLPVGVQVAGRTGADELVLDVMERLEEAFRWHAGYPAGPPSPMPG